MIAAPQYRFTAPAAIKIAGPALRAGLKNGRDRLNAAATMSKERRNASADAHE